jgi:uncharacterized protein (TIGR03083 family)
MEYVTYVDHLRHDGERLAEIAAGNLTAPVPSCPGWTVRDVVTHVAEVYEHKIACTDLGRPPDPWPPAWPDDLDPLEWFADAHARLLAMFDRNGPDSPSATWWPPDQTVGFWARRMAHETAVHRVDAELAAGTTTPVDAELATDGVDEILVIMLEGDWSDDEDPSAGGKRVAIETGASAWTVTLEPASVVVAHGLGPRDAALNGEPSEVLLWLWGRADDDHVSRSGDAAALELLRTRLALATQ